VRSTDTQLSVNALVLFRVILWLPVLKLDVLVTLTVAMMKSVNFQEVAATQRKNANHCVGPGSVLLVHSVMQETTENSVPADFHLEEMAMLHVPNVS
jgi:hypothetical protein